MIHWHLFQTQLERSFHNSKHHCFGNQILFSQNINTLYITLICCSVNVIQLVFITLGNIYLNWKGGGGAMAFWGKQISASQFGGEKKSVSERTLCLKNWFCRKKNNVANKNNFWAVIQKENMLILKKHSPSFKLNGRSIITQLLLANNIITNVYVHCLYCCWLL